MAAATPPAAAGWRGGGARLLLLSAFLARPRATGLSAGESAGRRIRLLPVFDPHEREQASGWVGDGDSSLIR